MLKIQKTELELISDLAMNIFFEKGTIGGISYISNRYNKAKTKCLKSYDLKEESRHIIYWDRYNLHGYAISKFYPRTGFKWIDQKKFDLNKYTSNNSKGCVLEFDLEYPKELHELYNDYPLATDKIEIKREMLSEYQLKIADLFNISVANIKKLVPNFLIKKIMWFIMITYNFIWD